MMKCKNSMKIKGRKCDHCKHEAIYLDNIDEAGHFNYICKHCGEPQSD